MHPLHQLLRSSGALPGLPKQWRQEFFELQFRNRRLGWIHKSFSPHLSSKYFNLSSQVVVLRSELSQKEITELTHEFRAKKLFSGWRDELYSARALDGAHEEMFHVERAFAKVFGLVRHSVHINGIVRPQAGGGGPKCWMGIRSKQKARFPGMLDNIVAGGLPRAMSPLECAVKECWEEASIDSVFALKQLKLVGSLTKTCIEDERFVGLEEIFVFDLELPAGFTPKPCDGEVESFHLLTCEQILQRGDVKPDVLLVVVDFMVRHGLVPVDNQNMQEYLDMIRDMHAPFPAHVFAKI